MSEERWHPTEIRALRGSDETTFVWSDGQTTTITNELLRGYCPCAGCQGHSGSIAFRPGGNPEIDDLVEVGNYALCIRWADGHDTGIYTWSFLRRLGAHAAQVGPRGTIAR
jgi:DUF971 family protein